MENPYFCGKIYYKWPFSIAMLNNRSVSVNEQFDPENQQFLRVHSSEPSPGKVERLIYWRIPSGSLT